MPVKLDFNIMKLSGAIAAGHIETAKAAELILRSGGNAFDAVVAAHFAACVAEPVLSSLGGGGFLLASKAGSAPELYDFFVQTPDHLRSGKPEFYPITADFGPVKQEFHIGAASMATPGTVRGLFQIHKDHCTMSFSELVEPAINLARTGVKVNAFQAEVFKIIKPIFTEEAESRSLFKSKLNQRNVITEGEILKLPQLADLMESLATEGPGLFYLGEIAKRLVNLSEERDGHISRDDLSRYRVIKRKPLKINFKGNKLWVNPPPSSGGILVAFALKLLDQMEISASQISGAAYAELLIQLQSSTEKARVDFMAKSDQTGFNEMLNREYLKMYRRQISGKLNAPRGTTHISVADGYGNFAALSASNGEGSGLIIPGTGVMMNNMLGEEDLNKAGFHKWQKNVRMTSMMAPGILVKKDGSKIVFGSGGSNRIRTAILQLLLNITDLDMTPEESVEASRLHIEKGFLNIEHGFKDPLLNYLIKNYPEHKLWETKSLFFGGTHIAGKTGSRFFGVGDRRRGGVAIIL